MIGKKPGKVRKLGKRRKTEKIEYVIPGIKEITDENAEQRNDRPYLYERLHFKNSEIDMTLLIDRTHKTMRVIDYRMQQYKKKCQVFDTIAKVRGIRKIYTLVEKQDTSSWRTVGFSKEGVVPLYFRTADGYVMSRLYGEDGEPITGGIAKLTHEKVPEFEEAEPPRQSPKGVKALFIDEPDEIREVIDSVWKDAGYTAFIKGASQPHLLARAASGRKKMWIGAEINDAFGHAKLDILTPPSTERERSVLAWLLLETLRELSEVYEVVSVFSFVRVDDEARSNVFNIAGFRMTGQLIHHFLDPEGASHDVLLWARKLQNLSSKDEAPLGATAEDDLEE